jgi:dihydroorotate dehydrogenase (fumarate)
MADLRTSYMGIELKNPIVVGACSLSKHIDTIRQIEAAGAGALIIKSLFEEQIQLERAKFEESLASYDELYAEAVHLFPKISHAGPKEHLYWVKETKRAVSIPLIASLNATSEEIWVDYAKQLADTGVSGLELNFYSLPLDATLGSTTIEQRELDAFSSVRAAVKIPIAVKLHPYYTNLLHVATELDRRGANAIVLFNRFFQPDIDVDAEKERAALMLSNANDSALSLRWVALLHGRIRADLIASTGIMTGKDVVKTILAGASAVQVVSTLYRNKITHLGEMRAALEAWMDEKGYATLKDFRGKVSKKEVHDPYAFERAQYLKLLLAEDRL